MTIPYDPTRHHRLSFRLKGYDYSRAGAYFVTICTQNREPLFGDIVAGDMRLNDAGVMIQAAWREIPSFYVGVGIDAFVVMRNHVHGIIILVGADPCVRPDTDDKHNADMDRVRADPRVRPDTDDTDDTRNAAMDRVRADPCVCPDTDDMHNAAMDRVRADPRVRPDTEGQARGPAPTKALSLGDVVQRYKMLTTKRYADGVKRCGWPPFPGRLWQRNYYEHIIRNEKEWGRIREYIAANPLRWAHDLENPSVPESLTEDAYYRRILGDET